MIVTSQSNPLAYLKAIATLVGSVVTGLLGIYTGDTEIGKVLTIVGIIATAIVTWSVPNADVLPESYEDEDDEYEDDGLTYEEAGGQPFPADYDESSLYGDGADRGAIEFPEHTRRQPESDDPNRL